jgi:NADPH:quinone reductase-like Zn-dependent oxidoreductase
VAIGDFGNSGSSSLVLGNILFREGVSPVKYPMRLGYDIVGSVVSKDANVRNVKTDDRVAAWTLTGGIPRTSASIVIG